MINGTDVISITKDLINVNCPLCGADNYKVILKEKFSDLSYSFDYLTETPSHFRIVECLDCYMVYSNPVLSEHKLLELYNSCDIGNSIDEEEIKSIRVNMARYLNHLIRSSGIKQGKVLEIGCGCGFFLDESRKSGFEIQGVEPSKKAADYANQILKLQSVTNMGYEKNLYPEKSFDLIAIIHVIDHVFNPIELVQNAYYHLKQGGYLLVCTHDISSLMAKFTKDKFIAYSIQHLSYYTPELLGKLLEKSGFEIVDNYKTLTTYSLKHFVENGVRNKFLRDRIIDCLAGLKMSNLRFTFPFGNIETIAVKN